MPNPAITAVSLFEVGKDADDLPFYKYRHDRNVAPGTPIEQIIAEAKAFPDSPEAAEARRPSRVATRPERDLDIHEGMRTGAQLYAFYLNVVDEGQPRLLFVEQGDPFIIFPMNSSTDEKPVTIQPHGADRRFASFIWDLDELRGSQLAGRIRASHHHSNVLSIPFYLNVVDPDPGIGVAPWVYDLSHAAPHPHGPPQFFTHGGVHLMPVAMLSAGV